MRSPKTGQRLKADFDSLSQAMEQSMSTPMIRHHLLALSLSGSVKIGYNAVARREQAREARK